MLTRIELRIPGDSASTNMDVAVPKGSTRYLVNDITGLGPVKADVGTSQLALLDGVSVDYTRTSSRNIVISFEYVPDYTSENSVYFLRQDLYKIAGPRKEVEMTFVIEGVGTRKIVGIVESVESPMFSSELTGQLSVICPVPYFSGAEKTVQLTTRTNSVINYVGDVPAGVRMQHKTVQVAQNFKFRRSHPSTGWQDLSIGRGNTVTAGHTIMSSSVDRDKYFKTWEGRNFLPDMDLFDWWKLLPGNNTLNLTATAVTGDYSTSANYQITYQELYWGL